MTTVIKRFPRFDISLITEDTDYLLTYDTKKKMTSKDFDESIISFSIKNAMEDDSPVFSLVLLAKDKWDKIVGANDLIKIKVTPDVTKGEPDNPYIMIGLISDIHKEGEYENGSLLYRITGRAMAKALVDFDVGVIQEVAVVIPTIGWLPDGTEKGLNFSGNTAAGIGDELMERFVYKHSKYNFKGGKGLKDYLTHSFSSWEDDENLADVTPFINYEGSLRQFLEDVAAKPFNELFFEYTNDGKCVAIMRPTPFDPDKWNVLPMYKFTSDIVVQESFGKSDNEMFSVYVVQAPNIAEFTSMDLGVFPKFHPSLIDKYGYSRLDAKNRYLLTSGAVGDISKDGGDKVEQSPMPTYDDIAVFIHKNKFDDPEVLRKKKDTIRTALAQSYPMLTKRMIDNIIESVENKTFSREEYNKISSSTGDKEKDREINKEKTVAGEKLENFTQRLFNWYCENANFYAGDIRVLGNPAYRIGSKILYDDFEQDTKWEFYLESVQHEFSFTSGYTTILGVTRGLPDAGKDRFSNLWGKSQDFKGGYLGEMSLEDLLAAAKEANSTYYGTGTGSGPYKPNDELKDGGWGNGLGGDIATKALNTANTMTKVKSYYQMGAGRTLTSPFIDIPVTVDCSSFVWWCYYTNGISLKGGKTGMTTDTIKADPRFTTVSERGESKIAAKAKLKQGDIVYFDTYKNDGHMGIYTGKGKFIGAQSSSGIAEADMTSGYWWDHFKGHAIRYNS